MSWAQQETDRQLGRKRAGKTLLLRQHLGRQTKLLSALIVFVLISQDFKTGLVITIVS